VTATALLCGGCETTTDVLWQATGIPHHKHPEQGWWSYQFVYYPNAQVYFEPYSKTWYWCEHGLWKGGPEPPQTLELNADHATVVKLQQELPFFQHETVIAMHPCRRELPPKYDPAFAVDMPARLASESPSRQPWRH
jgi:hypothetical protein